MFLYVVLYVKDKQAFLYTGNVSVTIESSWLVLVAVEKKGKTVRFHV